MWILTCAYFSPTHSSNSPSHSDLAGLSAPGAYLTQVRCSSSVPARTPHPHSTYTRDGLSEARAALSCKEPSQFLNPEMVLLHLDV